MENKWLGKLSLLDSAASSRTVWRCITCGLWDPKERLTAGKVLTSSTQTKVPK